MLQLTGSFYVRVLCLLVGVLALGADPVSAARPVKGATYADYFGFTAYLNVSKDGRSFNPRKSYVENGTSWECPGLDFHLGSRGRRVRISRSGHFRFTRRRGRFVLRVWGRFRTKNVVRINFRYRRHPRRRSRDCDDSGRHWLTPERIRPIAFRDCASHRAKTLLSAPTGRVFWESRWDDRDGWMTVAYACLFSVNRLVKLGQDDDDDEDVEAIRLVGPYVAYSRAYCPMGCNFDLTVIDLRDGRRVKRVGTGGITDLELKENGSVAWIEFASESEREVWAYDTTGRRQLDRGNIPRQSLTLEGSTLSWMKDGVTYTATLD
jgi:hypothetical protein